MKRKTGLSIVLAIVLLAGCSNQDLLGVAPDVEEYGVSFHYVVHRQELRLELRVWPMSGDVTVAVYCSTQLQPVINLSLLDCKRPAAPP